MGNPIHNEDRGSFHIQVRQEVLKTYYIHLSKPTECTIPRVQNTKNVNDGLGLIMVHRCRSTHCNKCTTLVGVLIMRKAMHVWKAEGIWVYGYVLSCVRLFATPRAVACQALLSVEFSRQE